MAFDEILHRVGDSGRFQIARIVIFIIVSLLSFSHDLMENFTAAIPDHQCSVNHLDNPKSEINITMNLTTEALLKVSIPMGPNQKPEQCRRFQHTHFAELFSNFGILLDIRILGKNIFLNQILLGAVDIPCKLLTYFIMRNYLFFRSTLGGIYNFAARIGTVMSALVLVTRKYFVHLPMILCGIIPIVASINIYFLPETLNLPLFDTIKDLEK
ncbi:hypothetical protein A6R68_07674, partial [Neotoma lepida]